MHELQVLITPSAVPCSSTGDPSQNPDPVTLQISVLNIAGVPVNLTGSALRFDFIVDPGGTDSAGALILSSNSVTPTGTPPTPIQAVHAAAVAGTAWSISATQDSPCAFIALPQPGAAIIAPQASISFTFANLLVDLVPGATPVAVTVLPAAPIGSVTTTGPGYVLKTPPGLGITSLTANPILLTPGGTSALAWTTTGVADCQLSWHPSDGAVVVYNGATLVTPAAEVPVQVDGTQPVEVTLNAQTEFTLSAEGVADISQSLVIDISEPALYLSASTLTVMPSEPFTLTWSAFNTAPLPTLTWLTPGVQMTDNATAQPIVAGQQLAAAEGSATVQVQQPTQFSLEVSTRETSLTVNVFVVHLANVIANPVEFTAPGPNGSLSITSENAVGFDITGPNGTEHYTLTHPVGGVQSTLDYQVVDPAQSHQYWVQALGYPGPDPAANQSITASTHAKVSVSSFTANPASITSGDSTTLSWSSFAATGFTIDCSTPTGMLTVASLGAGSTSLTITPTATTTYRITANGDTFDGSPPPTLSLTVTVQPKPKEGKEGKEGKERKEGKEKRPPQQEELHFSAFRANLPAELTGTQQAFIGKELRPEPADDQTPDS